MSSTLKALGIDRLSPAERIALAQEILDSVVAELPAASDPVSKPHPLQGAVLRFDRPTDSVAETDWGVLR